MGASGLGSHAFFEIFLSAETKIGLNSKFYVLSTLFCIKGKFLGFMIPNFLLFFIKLSGQTPRQRMPTFFTTFSVLQNLRMYTYRAAETISEILRSCSTGKTPWQCQAFSKRIYAPLADQCWLYAPHFKSEATRPLPFFTAAIKEVLKKARLFTHACSANQWPLLASSRDRTSR